MESAPTRAYRYHVVAAFDTGLPDPQKYSRVLVRVEQMLPICVFPLFDKHFKDKQSTF